MAEQDDEKTLREAVRRVLYVAPVIVLIVVIVYGLTREATLR